MGLCLKIKGDALGLLLELDIYTASQTLEIRSAIYTASSTDQSVGGDPTSHKVVKEDRKSVV